MKIKFKKFKLEDVPLYYKWCDKPYIKKLWFKEGYEPKEAILDKIKGNGISYPFIIKLNNKSIGYIQFWDCIFPTEIFPNEKEGTYGVDLFIGEEECLNRGIGTATMKAFVKKVFCEVDANKIVIDPSETNKRAIKCYEKIGFIFTRKAFDGTEILHIMEIKKENFIKNRRS
jgi:aminoglycoside 6'-N-acetyltransferase